jgi:hypothetical protein
MNSLPALDSILQYKNQGVINRFKMNFPAKADKSDELFVGVIKYLWLSKKHELERAKAPDDQAVNFVFVMHEEMRDIDEMWHCFILYTKDYFDFCSTYFGTYMHHVPNVVEDMPQSPVEFESDLNKYLAYVYDHLGEETLQQWFAIHLIAPNTDSV